MRWLKRYFAGLLDMDQTFVGWGWLTVTWGDAVTFLIGIGVGCLLVSILYVAVKT